MRGQALKRHLDLLLLARYRLQKGGYLSSEWTEVQGRRRRTYRLTESGRRALGEQRLAWHDFTQAMSIVLKGVPWPDTP